MSTRSTGSSGARSRSSPTERLHEEIKTIERRKEGLLDADGNDEQNTALIALLPQLGLSLANLA
ncbi:hypothetical protein [Streptomyces flaveus]|uniref:hypothetical protein n=1 Tax=Streptomyces flaveus TaxID=66370 RepID=UPI00167087A3|nr:hypothetical protein [Streptomyces flaveus]